MQDVRLSVSKVKTFDACKKKFKFTYILKLPRKEFEFFALGKFLHLALEIFHQTIRNNPAIPLNKIMSDAFREAKKEYGTKLNSASIKECFNILDQYLKIISTNKAHTLSVPVLEEEKSFELKLTENIMLVGAIDRIQMDPDGILHIADYKTTKNAKYLQNDLFQLMTYCYVLLNENPSIETIRASYILLRHNCEFITKEFSKEEILRLKDKYIAYANQITSETEYQASPTKLCSYCEFIDVCEEGKKQTNKFNGEVKW